VKIGAVILCRHSSRRLPGKILREVRGLSVLGHIFSRVDHAMPRMPIVVATSAEASDDPIAEYCRRASLECYRGSLHDVAGRFLAAAQGKGWDFAIRINGDNLFVDPETLRVMAGIVGTNAFDLVTNVPGRTFPAGMSIEIIRLSFYAEVIGAMSASEHREHVTSWLYEHPEKGARYVYRNTAVPEAAGYSLAIDSEKDVARAESILSRTGLRPASSGLREIWNAFSEEKASTYPWRGKTGPLLVAEIGGNHEGDFSEARKLCGLAIESGVDCVKFQVYRGNTLVSAVESADRHAHFQRFELPIEDHLNLARMCRDNGVDYLASVWDMEMLEQLDEYMSIYKVGSGDLTAWPLLKEFARRGKPILLSTGLSTMDEVLQTVRQIQAVDERYKLPEWMCLLQCTSMYPIPDQDANLHVMESFRELTGLSAGYSDHTVGCEALVAAATMGAEVLEFHFTDDREGKSFRDHKVSLTKEEVMALRDAISRVADFGGDGIKKPQPSELEHGHEMSFRRGVYLKRPLKAGERIEKQDLVFLRPAHGTDPRDCDLVAGSVALRAIPAYRAIHAGDDYAQTK